MKGLLAYFKEILYLLGDNRKKLVWLLSLFLVSSFLDIVGLGIIGPYLALVMNPSKMAEGRLGDFLVQMGITMPPKEVLIILGIGLVIVFFFKAIAAVYIYREILTYSRKCRVDLQGKLMQAYQQQPYIEYLQRNSSEYIKSIHDATAHFVSSVEGLLRMLGD